MSSYFQYKDSKKEKVSTKEWSEWSMKHHTEDEIRKRILDDPNSLCYSYVCGFSKMSAEFIEELMALSTGLLKKYNYEDYIDNVMKAIQIKLGVEDGDIDNIDLPSLTVEDKVIEGKELLQDKIDWSYIARNQKLPNWFKVKYKKYLKPKELTVNKLENISKGILKNK